MGMSAKQKNILGWVLFIGALIAFNVASEAFGWGWRLY